jgi:uncharacterized membrane protein YgdD (TMEM256/DUF423 family)
MKFISIGAILAMLAVVFGAFGTHGLRGKIGYDLLQIYETGTYYMMVHAFAIMIYGIWFALAKNGELKPWPIWLFLVGTFIFTGSLYAITFTTIRTFGAITPIGGVCYIAGWIIFALQAYRTKI